MPLLLPECKLTFLCGPVRSGKTHLIKQWLARDNRHVILDSTGEFMEDGAHEQVWANPRALYERLKKNPYYYKLVYQPGLHLEEDFKYVLNALWWIDQSKLLVCDEFHQVCPVMGSDESVVMLNRFARHARLGFIGASQRVADVSKLYTSACAMVVLFYTEELRDLEAIEGRWGCADMVSSLRPLKYDDIRQVTLQVPQCVVKVRGEKPYIFDFANDSPAEGSLSQESDGEAAGSQAAAMAGTSPDGAIEESKNDNLDGLESPDTREG